MKIKIGRYFVIAIVLLMTSQITIPVWMVNDKTLLETFGEIVESNRDYLEGK